jgi:transcriptional regulator with XRE-family HTH domain
MPLSLADTLAANLRSRRGSLSQRAFAQKLGLGNATLSRLEAGTQSVTLKTLERISKRLRCDPLELLLAPK